jgi:beta propeller repeat protein
MKRLLILLILISIVTFSGCVKQDEKPIKVIKTTTTQKPTITTVETTSTTIAQKTKIPSKLISVGEDKYDFEQSDIYENRIVFLKNNYRDNKIYDFIYDIVSGKTTQMCVNQNCEELPIIRCDNPQIYENKVICIDKRFGYPELFMYDIITYEEKGLNVTISNFISDFDFFGDYVLWADPYSDKTKIYFYDLKTETSGTFTIGELNNGDINGGQFSVYENKIVWAGTTGIGTHDTIFLYDISKNITSRISQTNSEQLEPSIYKNKIVWADNRNGVSNFDIYMYDLETDQETQITKYRDSSERNPAIYGDKIVYFKGADVLLYDLSTGMEKRISNDDGSKSYLQIFEDKIVWEGYSTGEDKVILIYK